MGLVLNEEQRLLRESARELLSVKSPVSALRALRDSKDESGFSRELWRELVELGWAGMTLPEDMGGLDFGFQGLAVTFEEAGRTLAATPLLDTVVLGARLVEKLKRLHSNELDCQGCGRHLAPRSGLGRATSTLQPAAPLHYRGRRRRWFRTQWFEDVCV